MELKTYSQSDTRLVPQVALGINLISTNQGRQVEKKSHTHTHTQSGDRLAVI
jgi:hypothetical protein